MAGFTAARIVKFLNFVILAVLATVVAGVYWFAWRPLAKTSGMITAPVTANASVLYDRLGVPHIRAGNLDDALFVQGYATAQDRIFQMDLIRRLTAGELSEVFGPLALETDRESRRLRLRRVAELAYSTLPEADRAAFAAYTRGVNEYLATHR